MSFIRFILILSIFLFPFNVVADSGTDAIEAISKANEAYESGDFYEAIRQYRFAFELTKDPRVLYRIGITYESLGNFQRAREFLEIYLKQSNDTKYVGRVKKKVETLRKIENTVQSTAVLSTLPTRALVFLESESHTEFGRTPINVPLAPGSHTFKFVKEGYETRTLTIQIDSSQTIKEKVRLSKIKMTVVKKKLVKKEKKKIEEPVEEPIRNSIYDRQIRPVRLGPSSSINILLWTGIGISAFSVLIAAIGVADGSLKIPSLPLFLAGSGVFTLSGYFLWVHDWDSDRRSVNGLPPTKSLTIGFKY